MIACIFVLLFPWSTSPRPFQQELLQKEISQHIEAGRKAESERRFDVAVEEFRKVTELEPSVPAAFVSLGQAWMEQRDYGAAIPALKHALDLDATSAPAHQLLGYALLVQGYATEAIPHLERVHEQSALGIAQILTGQFSEAIANLQAALQKRPNDQDLLYYLGRASGLLSKQSIDALLAVNPNSPRAHQAMEENYFVLRRMPEAEKEGLEALRLRPDLPEVHLELGEVYAADSQWAKAELEFRAQSQLQPGNAEAAYRLGSALLEQGKVHEARIELVRADKLMPEMPETLYSLGKAASLDGDAATAESAWIKLLSIEKQSPLAAQAHFGLATLYRKQGKMDAAQKHMQEFQKLQQNSGPAQ
ncbi:MAG TPA: tetratricopeptide repeat protein [Candidatus Sulfotelmatobacter sp.]